MVSQYVYLGLLAALIAAIGSLVWSLHLSRTNNRQLSTEREQLLKELELQKQAATEFHNDAERSNALVRLLDRQVRQRSSEIDVLRMLLLRRDQEIHLLQRDAEKARSPVSTPEQGGRPPEGMPPSRFGSGEQPTASLITLEEQQALLSPSGSSSAGNRAGEREGQHAGENITRAWKENLERMLGVLDAIEREVRQ